MKIVLVGCLNYGFKGKRFVRGEEQQIDDESGRYLLDQYAPSGRKYFEQVEEPTEEPVKVETESPSIKVKTKASKKKVSKKKVAKKKEPSAPDEEGAVTI